MSGTDLRVGNREILLGMIVLLLFRWLLGTRGFVASEMRFGPRHVFGLSGKHFECRNAREFWNDAPAGRKAGTLWGTVACKRWNPGGCGQWKFVFSLLVRV